MDFLFAHRVTGDTAAKISLLGEVASFLVLSLPGYFQLGIIRCYNIILIRTEGMGNHQTDLRGQKITCQFLLPPKDYLDFGGNITVAQQIRVCDLLLANRRIQKRRTSRKESSCTWYAQV